MRVFMLPTIGEAEKDTTNSINHIVLFLRKHLARLDVEIVDDPNRADLIAAHAGMAPMLARGRACVAHCHGLYPTALQDQTAGWHWQANQLVVENIIGARRVTVPSQWVADIFRRDMHFNPDVIGWGVDLAEWQNPDPQGYVLWNKTRVDGVCSPVPLNQLAQRALDTKFVTTFAAPGKTSNVQETGRVLYDVMRKMVQGASVYLATTKETFGIGTLEAMACGIPVLGFRHGATPDLVEHGVTGYLVDPGDYDGLREGLDYCLQYRETLGDNAREKVRAYTWDNVARQFLDVYRAAIQPVENPRVSIVIPVYNYANYVAGAIDSASKQQLPDGSYPEIIVVNDGSTDDSEHVARSALQALDRSSLTQLLSTSNGGVASARNTGIAAARGEYIVCLDADDQIGPGFIDTCTRSLDADRSLGIVFTSLRFIDESGQPGRVSDWPNGYDFDKTVTEFNQVPTCCMFRKEAWARAGGYKKRYTPAEDAALWLAIGAYGWRAAQCTNAALFHYRMHANSLSHDVRTGKTREPNWRDRNWVTDGQRPFASDGHAPFYSWPVRNYDRPKVTIIVPVGPYHADILREALDSIEDQLERAWELIVVNDTGGPLDLTAHPFARVLDTAGAMGPSHARNQGIKAARTSLVAFLDADDVWRQDFLKQTLRAYAIHHRYVYTDWVSLNKAGDYESHITPEYDPNDVFQKTSIHSINILIERQQILDVGGFDESMWSWEDTDLFMRLAAAGYCGVRCAQPLTLYRYTTGRLRERGFDQEIELKALLSNRYARYINGGEIVGCCGMPVTPPIEHGPLAPDQGIRIVYNGPKGSHDVVGPATKRSYGRRQGGDIFYVFGADQMASTKLFTPVIDPVEQVQPTMAPPPPMAVGSTP